MKRSGYTWKVNIFLGGVHATREEFANGDFTLKRITGHFGGKPEKGEILHYYGGVVVFRKFRFQKVYRPHENAKPSFSISSGMKSVFEKLRFVDGRPNRLK